MHDAANELHAAVQLRLKHGTFALIENWRRSQAKIPSRSEAIRQLVERALATPEDHQLQEREQEGAPA